MLTWIGIIFTVAVLVGWVLYEQRMLVRHVARLRARDASASDQG